MMDPLDARRSPSPQPSGDFVFLHRSSAARVAIPMSKFRPLLEKCALSIQRVYLKFHDVIYPLQHLMA